jgi:hypothetical protein
MFRLIKDFNSNINEILLDTNSDETIEDYSNKITSFFENQRNRAIEAIKSNPISAERQDLANKKLIEDAKLQSEKIQSESQAEILIAKADLNARQESHNMSKQEWQQFDEETKLFSSGIFNFTTTFTNPIFDNINSLINFAFTLGYRAIIFLLCFGAWYTGLPNAIFYRIKKMLERDTKVQNQPQRIEPQERDTQQPIAVQNQPQRVEPQEREEMNEEELRYFREWRRDLSEEDRSEEDRRRQEEEDRRRQEEQPRRRGRRPRGTIGGTMKLKNKISKTKKNKRITRNKTKKNKRMNKKNKKTKRRNKKF